MDAGARLAEPGEFTLRAFLNGKVDLVQAEAVADLIEAVTPLQARAAFDQLEGHAHRRRSRAIESGALRHRGASSKRRWISRTRAITSWRRPRRSDVDCAKLTAQLDDLLAQAARGRLIREGAQVAIVGAPNVGKSSLFNALLNTNRAIVTAIPGTTRDLLTERADIGGLSLSLIDTAGVRDNDGCRRAGRRARAQRGDRRRRSHHGGARSHRARC